MNSAGENSGDNGTAEVAGDGDGEGSRPSFSRDGDRDRDRRTVAQSQPSSATISKKSSKNRKKSTRPLKRRLLDGTTSAATMRKICGDDASEPSYASESDEIFDVKSSDDDDEYQREKRLFEQEYSNWERRRTVPPSSPVEPAEDDDDEYRRGEELLLEEHSNLTRAYRPVPPSSPVDPAEEDNNEDEMRTTRIFDIIDRLRDRLPHVDLNTLFDRLECAADIDAECRRIEAQYGVVVVETSEEEEIGGSRRRSKDAQNNAAVGTIGEVPHKRKKKNGGGGGDDAAIAEAIIDGDELDIMHPVGDVIVVVREIQKVIPTATFESCFRRLVSCADLDDEAHELIAELSAPAGPAAGGGGDAPAAAAMNEDDDDDDDDRPGPSGRNSSSSTNNNARKSSQPDGLSEFLQPEQRDAVEKILQMFPDCDPYYVVKQIAEENTELAVLVDRMASSAGSYPKLKDRLAKERRERRRQECTDPTMFRIDEFLKTFPDPADYFGNIQRPVSELYRYHAVAQLQNDFHNVDAAFLSEQLEQQNNHYYPAFRAVREAVANFPFLGYSRKKKGAANRTQVPYLSTPRQEPMPFPDEVDELFYRELQYVVHQDEISEYLRVREESRQRRVETVRGQNQLGECPCCCSDDVLPEELITCGNAASPHRYCQQCIRRHAEEIIGQGRHRISCLSEDCEEDVPLDTLRRILLPRLVDLMWRRSQQEEIRQAGIDNMETCPFCDFAIVMDVAADDDRVFSCQNPECLKQSCRLCKQPNHIPLKCNEVERADETAMRTFVENRMAEALIRTCPKCGKRIIKEDGCNKMCCPCGVYWCYVCRKELDRRDPYAHFHLPESRKDGAPKCRLYTQMHEVHDAAAKKAGVQARDEYLAKHPDFQDGRKKVDVEKLVGGSGSAGASAAGRRFHPDDFFQELEWADAQIRRQIAVHRRAARDLPAEGFGLRRPFRRGFGDDYPFFLEDLERRRRFPPRYVNDEDDDDQGDGEKTTARGGSRPRSTASWRPMIQQAPRSQPAATTTTTMTKDTTKALKKCVTFAGSAVEAGGGGGSSSSSATIPKPSSSKPEPPPMVSGGASSSAGQPSATAPSSYTDKDRLKLEVKLLRKAVHEVNQELQRSHRLSVRDSSGGQHIFSSIRNIMAARDAVHRRLMDTEERALRAGLTEVDFRSGNGEEETAAAACNLTNEDIEESIIEATRRAAEAVRREEQEWAEVRKARREEAERAATMERALVSVQYYVRVVEQRRAPTEAQLREIMDNVRETVLNPLRQLDPANAVLEYAEDSFNEVARALAKRAAGCALVPVQDYIHDMRNTLQVVEAELRRMLDTVRTGNGGGPAPASRAAGPFRRIYEEERDQLRAVLGGFPRRHGALFQCTHSQPVHGNNSISRDTAPWPWPSPSSTSSGARPPIVRGLAATATAGRPRAVIVAELGNVTAEIDRLNNDVRRLHERRDQLGRELREAVLREDDRRGGGAGSSSSGARWNPTPAAVDDASDDALSKQLREALAKCKRIIKGPEQNANDDDDEVQVIGYASGRSDQSKNEESTSGCSVSVKPKRPSSSNNLGGSIEGVRRNESAHDVEMEEKDEASSRNSANAYRDATAEVLSPKKPTTDQRQVDRQNTRDGAIWQLRNLFDPIRDNDEARGNVEFRPSTADSSIFSGGGRAGLLSLSQDFYRPMAQYSGITVGNQQQQQQLHRQQQLSVTSGAAAAAGIWTAEPSISIPTSAQNIVQINVNVRTPRNSDAFTLQRQQSTTSNSSNAGQRQLPEADGGCTEQSREAEEERQDDMWY